MAAFLNSRTFASDSGEVMSATERKEPTSPQGAEVIWHVLAGWESWQQVEQATASWMQLCDTERLHSTLGNVPRVEHEEFYFDRTQGLGEPVAA